MTTSLRSTITKANEMSESIRGHDTGDWLDNLWANALPRAGLGSAEAPEPDKPSPPFGCHPFRKEHE
jgi:hypothetical protein